jgi:hypothetical protein
MYDHIVSSFLERQLEEALALARESDLLNVIPITPQHFVVQLKCKGLVKNGRGEIVTAENFEFGVYFSSDYPRRANPMEVVSWFGPREVFHPNISDVAPIICIGHLAPGTSLVDIIRQVFQIVTYQKVTMREDDALNRDACAWARQNQHRFPIDNRPLKRRKLNLEIEDLRKEEKA